MKRLSWWLLEELVAAGEIRAAGVHVNEPIVVAVQGAVVTLEKFHKDQFCANGEPTFSLRQLQRLCQTRQLPGAFKLGRKWMVNMVEMIRVSGAQLTLPHLEPAAPKPRNSKTGEPIGAKKLPKGYVGDGLDDFDITVPLRYQRN